MKQEEISIASRSSERLFQIYMVEDISSEMFCNTLLTVCPAGIQCAVKIPRSLYTKIIIIFEFPFFLNSKGLGEDGVCHSDDCLFDSGSYLLISVSAIVTIRFMKHSPLGSYFYTIV